MSAQITAPKIFISYSWKPVLNKEKVIALAERLSANGVHVIIDVWDLKEGQDKNQFMEQMVNSTEIKRVLLICNKDYAEKANKRVGGVGIESLIISNEIYNQADQTKFIPIVFEYNEADGKPYIPTFVNSRIFIDLSNDEVFEEQYEMLMRNLFDKPTSKRPPLGTPPPYLQDEDPVFLQTSHKVATMKRALLDEKKNAVLFVQDYYDTFINYLPTYLIEESNLDWNNADEVVLTAINKLIPLRDDFIYFFETYCTHAVELDIERMHSFFEKLLGFLLNLDGIGDDQRTIRSLKIDHLRFFFHELFLYFTSVMLSKERFKELGYILHNPFVVYIERHNVTREVSFTNFRIYVAALNEFRKQRLKLNRVSVTADIIKERTTGKVTFKDLQQADSLLYYISLLLPSNTFVSNTWFPETTSYYVYALPIMEKAISKKFFDKVSPIFNVSSKEELLEKVKEVEVSNRDTVQRFDYEIPQIRYGLNLEKICTLR